MPPIDSVPPEILYEVFKNVRAESFSTLAASLGVSKRWRDIALPLVYRDVFMREHNIKLFCEEFSDKNRGLIRSLTIALNLDRVSVIPWPTLPEIRLTDKAPHGLEEDDEASIGRPWLGYFPSFPSASPRTHFLDLKACMRRLAWTLPNLPRLSTLSLKVKKVDGPLLFCQFVISCLEGLPKSCVNLEIEGSIAFCHAKTDFWSESHVCPSIRRVLPRMENVRLRLPNMCPEFCGRWTRGAGDARILKTIDLPKLRNLTIVCDQMLGCSSFDRLVVGLDWDFFQPEYTAKVWSKFTTTLQRLIDNGGKLRPDARIYLTMLVQEDWDRRSTDLVVEMVSKTTLAVPSEALVLREPGQYGSLFFSTPRPHRPIRDGPWHYGIVGERSATRQQDLHEWMKENVPVFWRGDQNGDKASVAKIDPFVVLWGEERKDPEAYLELESLVK